MALFGISHVSTHIGQWNSGCSLCVRCENRLKDFRVIGRHLAVRYGIPPGIQSAAIKNMQSNSNKLVDQPYSFQNIHNEQQSAASVWAMRVQDKLAYYHSWLPFFH